MVFLPFAKKRFRKFLDISIGRKSIIGEGMFLLCWRRLKQTMMIG